MSKSPSTISRETLELYDRLVATNPKVERKGASMPYTSCNGHMFSFLTPLGKLALRLPAAERDEFLTKYKGRLCEQHGTVMKEYVEVPDSLLGRTTELGKYFDASHAYVASLKPKPTKKASATKAPAKKPSTKKAAE